jgi:preprotein translocase subunit YajC
MEFMLYPAFLILQSAPAGTSSLLSGILPIVLMFAIAYFLIFLPVQKQRKQQQNMLKALQNGQTVVTSGGIVGTIVAVNGDDTLILRVKPDNLKLQVSRASVTSVVSADGQIAKK